jgi:hypothetical protein
MPEDLKESAKQWAIGLGQNIKGKNQDEFCREFLSALPDHVAASLETECKQLFEMKTSFARFRKQYIMTMSAMYLNGVIAEQHHQAIDPFAMITKIAKKNELK